MNKETKQKMEEASLLYADSANTYAYVPDHVFENSFECGSEWLWDQGYQFTAEDMAEFAYWYSMNWDIDFKPEDALKVWDEEKEQTMSPYTTEYITRAEAISKVLEIALSVDDKLLERILNETVGDKARIRFEIRD